MTEQDKNSIGLSFNQRRIKRKKREIGDIYEIQIVCFVSHYSV